MNDIVYNELYELEPPMRVGVMLNLDAERLYLTFSLLPVDRLQALPLLAEPRLGLTKG